MKIIMRWSYPVKKHFKLSLTVISLKIAFNKEYLSSKNGICWLRYVGWGAINAINSACNILFDNMKISIRSPYPVEGPIYGTFLFVTCSFHKLKKRYEVVVKILMFPILTKHYASRKEKKIVICKLPSKCSLSHTLQMFLFVTLAHFEYTREKVENSALNGIIASVLLHHNHRKTGYMNH